MTTIAVDVPFKTKKNKFIWEEFLQLLWREKQDIEDVKLVEEEMKNPQSSITLQEYLKSKGLK